MPKESSFNGVVSSDESEFSLATEYSSKWNAGDGPPDLAGFLQNHSDVTPPQRARLGHYVKSLVRPMGLPL